VGRVNRERKKDERTLKGKGEVGGGKKRGGGGR
jgi:hypothetical protein